MPNPRDPQIFKGEKSANRAIARAIRLRVALANAVFNLTPALLPFAEPGEFTVQKVNTEPI